MDSSFFEYRDKTGEGSDSDSEAIDNSLEVNNSLTCKKKSLAKNQTVFVAESDESSTDDESDEDAPTVPKIVLRRSSSLAPRVISSSDDDTNKRGSIRRQSQLEISFNNVVLSSSDEESPEASPELVPRRRPPQQPAIKTTLSPNTSIIGRKKNKRMILVDSDTENSFVIEHNKNKKMVCLKDTPVRVDDNKMAMRRNLNVLDQSVSYTDEHSDDDLSDDYRSSNKQPKTPSRIKNLKDLNETDETSDDKLKRGKDNLKTDNEHKNVQEHKSEKKKQASIETQNSDDDKKKPESVLTDDSDEEEGQNDDDEEETEVLIHRSVKKKQTSIELRKSDKAKPKIIGVNDDDCDKNKPKSVETDDSEEEEGQNDDDEEETDDEGPDEDQMVYSRATRMSIMGLMPKGVDESDDSDFIQSDEKSRSSSADSLSELPDATIVKQTEVTPQKPSQDTDSSIISCSPFSSPLNNITNENKPVTPLKKDSFVKPKSLKKNKLVKTSKENEDDEVTFVSSFDEGKPLDDDDVTFVSTNQTLFTPGKGRRERVIDDEVTIVETKTEIIALSSDEELTPEKPAIKRSPKLEKAATMNRYLVPPSYPNQQVVYVKNHVKQTEMSKLNGLKEDLHNVKHLMDQMDLETLPDGGMRLTQRLSELLEKVKQQGEKVARMVVEPAMPTAEDMAADGFNQGLSWEELQKGSQAVQPRMFGRQAMATHMAERNLILERLRDLHESLASRPPESQLAPPPPAISSKMMEHQLHALAWLRWRETQKPAGGILADDMGLGKTITMISLIVSDKDNKIDDDDDADDDDDDEGGRGISKLARGGTLVVCPASLMQQWNGEVSKHCVKHAATVCLHHGPARATHPHRLAANDIVLTTYNILQRDNEKNGVLMKVLWRRIILDEAHIVRNYKSATSIAVSALKGRHRWCLTGTPVQNKDLDLFALLKFLRCTPFDEITMWKKWIDNKSQGGQDRLSTIMQCILLRRTKVQLQERGQLNCLPERTTHLQEVTLTKEEMNVYQKVLVFSKTLFAQFLHQRAEKQADMQGFSTGDNAAYDKMHKRMIALQGAKPVKSHEILVLLLRLRQVCCHCGLIAAMLDEETAADGVDMDPGGQDLLAELNKLSIEDSRSKRKSREASPFKEEENEPPSEGTTAAEAIRSVLSPNNPVFQLDTQSSKIKAVMDCLHSNVFPNKGHKAVVVSQWTAVLSLIEKELKAARVRSVTLSGSVPVPQRPPLIDKLNDPSSDVRVMLLSLCAGGVGLNLCGANHLLLTDPHWNPQLEEQAQDRIYRVGQAKPVSIYRFMCVDTVEQTIRKLQQAKLELADNVLTGAKNTNNSKLTIEDLKMLFNMGQTQD